MSRNLEGNDSKVTKHNGLEDSPGKLLSESFGREDQASVFKRSENSKDVGSIDFDAEIGIEKGRRKDFPHNWYESSKKNAYGLPSDYSLSNGVEATMRLGWSKLNNA